VPQQASPPSVNFPIQNPGNPEIMELPFIFEAPKLAIFDAKVPQQASPPSVNFPIQNPEIIMELPLIFEASLPSLNFPFQNPGIEATLETMEPQQPHQQDTSHVSAAELSRILDQIDTDGLVESLCNLTHVSNANTYEAPPPPVYVPIQNPEVEAETKGTKRRPQNPVNSEGQLLSNSIYLSKGGPKASNRGQDEAEDLYDLLSDSQSVGRL